MSRHHAKPKLRRTPTSKGSGSGRQGLSANGQRHDRLRPARTSSGRRRFTYPSEGALQVAVTSLLSDYVVEPDEEAPTAPWIETVSMLHHPCLYRTLAREPYATGEGEVCFLADGFFVQALNIGFSAPTVMSVTAPDVLRVRIATEGDGEYAPEDAEALYITAPSAAIIIEPPGQPPANAAFFGHNRAIHVYIHRAALKRLYAGGEQGLAEVLQDFLNGDLRRTVAHALPLSPGMLRCLEDLFSCPLEGHNRWLFIRCKAVEILCHAFDALAQKESAGSVTLTTRAVLKAQRILMGDFVSPPTLEQLAQAVGISRSGLCSGFRQIIGQSIYDYVQDLRMQHALALLAERSTSITEIAYAVGYTHSSSFSVAVQRRFGATPRELRRRGVASTA